MFPKDFQIFAKVTKFCQIWSHWSTPGLRVQHLNLLHRVPHDQCDQIGRFLKSLVDKFSLKWSQNLWWLFGPQWKKLPWLLLATFWTKLGYFLFHHLVTLWPRHTSSSCLPSMERTLFTVDTFSSSGLYWDTSKVTSNLSLSSFTLITWNGCKNRF